MFFIVGLGVYCGCGVYVVCFVGFVVVGFGEGCLFFWFGCVVVVFVGWFG